MSFVKRLFEQPKMPKMNPVIIQQDMAPFATPASSPIAANAGTFAAGAPRGIMGRGALIASGMMGGLTKKTGSAKKSLIGGVG